MSVATELAPEVYIPPQARTSGSNALALAPVPFPVPAPQRRHLRAIPASEESWSVPTTAPLRRLQAAPVRATPLGSPLRLTRRGITVLVGFVLAVGVLLVTVAAVSGPPGTQGAGASVPAEVTVQPGDTLWAIASRLAPNRDPRAEIADLQQVNGISGVELIAGQVLRTR
ncbi:MAG TPA: LysM peptidoglycan-binding domain-containing protein [Jatrophihabitans sp.]|jgi:LysM repeat protein